MAITLFNMAHSAIPRNATTSTDPMKVAKGKRALKVGEESSEQSTILCIVYSLKLIFSPDWTDD